MTLAKGSAISTGKYLMSYLAQTSFRDLLFDGLEDKGFGKWGFADTPQEMARLMIAHIDKKRSELGIDKARERVMMDFAARQAL